MHYRIAIQPRGSVCWQWESTVLSSLDAVLRFLRLYQAFPADRLRVFSFSSREERGTQLAREHSGLESHSVTVEQFLRARLIYTQETTADVPTYQTHKESEMATISSAKRSLQERSTDGHALNEKSMSVLDRRRIEVEYGAGSDHDLPYSFAIPHSWPLVFAWMKLLARVHSGVLPP